MQQQFLAKVRETNAVMCLRFDGKLLADISLGYSKYVNVDRLPVVATCADFEQLLGVAKLKSGTRQNIAEAAVRSLMNGVLTSENTLWHFHLTPPELILAVLKAPAHSLKE
jgi:hypothetical protein